MATEVAKARETGLVLARCKDESIYLDFPSGLPAGSVVRIQVTDLQSNKVWLRTMAPPEVVIIREELRGLAKGVAS